MTKFEGTANDCYTVQWALCPVIYFGARFKKARVLSKLWGAYFMSGINSDHCTPGKDVTCQLICNVSEINSPSINCTSGLPIILFKQYRLLFIVQVSKFKSTLKSSLSNRSILSAGNQATGACFLLTSCCGITFPIMLIEKQIVVVR